MTRHPDWLPDLLDFDWNRYVECLEVAYRVFARDWNSERDRPLFNGMRMGLKRHPEFDGKSATFWHFVTSGPEEADREPVRERIERIAWPKAMIVEAGRAESRVHVWSNSRRSPGHSKSKRWVVSLDDYSYVVIIEDRAEYALPWTAYTVDELHQRRKREQEHRAWRDRQQEG